MSFNPCFNGSDSKSSPATANLSGHPVSILVLMEVTLKVLSATWRKANYHGFNPCFNGSDSKRAFLAPLSATLPCFNPCFNGSDSKS